MTKRVVLVDGSSILYRAFFAMPHLMTPTGIPTGAVVGTVTMLLAIIEELEPQYMGVFFDRKAPTYRHELYKEYKGTRETMPDELVTQLVMVRTSFDPSESRPGKRTATRRMTSSACTVLLRVRLRCRASSTLETMTSFSWWTRTHRSA